MRIVAMAALILVLAERVLAIGPQNVVIVVSEKSPDSLELANYYAQKRGIPKSHIVRIPLPPLEVFGWSGYKPNVYDIVEDHIRRHRLEGRISVWATMPGCPFIVDENSSAGAVFFGGSQPPSTNPQSPGTFEAANGYYDKMIGYSRPKDATVGGYLEMRVDAGSIEATRRLIDRSVLADGTFPTGTVYLMDGEGPRSSRKDSIPAAQKLLEVLGRKVVHRKDAKLEGATDVLGLYTGLIWMNVPANKYLPGALADHLTSFGGRMQLYRGQLPASDFLAAGCSGSYGTVVEPYNYPAKFPTAQLHLYYALGFSAVESYWMSVIWPHQGLFLGDPLTRPFGKPPSIAVNELVPGSEVSGTVEFDVVAQVSGGGGVASVEVLVDRSRVHQAGFGRLPADTVFEVTFGEQKVSHISPQGQTLGQAVVALAGRMAATGMQVTVRPGLLFVLQPTGSGRSAAITAKCSSPVVPVEVLGTRKDEGKPTTGVVTWQLAGQSGPGDVLTLTLRENGKPIQTLTHEIPFERPAASVCTSLRLGWQSKLPKGYKLDTELVGDNPNTGIVRIQAAVDRVANLPSASLSLSPKPGSTLSVPDNGRPRGLAGQGLEGLDIGCVRFGLGPPALRTRPQIDTTKWIDGRHTVEIIATLGSATEASNYVTFPIVVRNGKERLEIEPVTTELKTGPPSRIGVAKAKVAPNRFGKVRFFVDGNEVPPPEVREGVLLMEPNKWGVGTHSVTASLREGDGKKDTLLSDNEVVVTISAGAAPTISKP